MHLPPSPLDGWGDGWLCASWSGKRAFGIFISKRDIELIGIKDIGYSHNCLPNIGLHFRIPVIQVYIIAVWWASDCRAYIGWTVTLHDATYSIPMRQYMIYYFVLLLEQYRVVLFYVFVNLLHIQIISCVRGKPVGGCVYTRLNSKLYLMTSHLSPTFHCARSYFEKLLDCVRVVQLLEHSRVV